VGYVRNGGGYVVYSDGRVVAEGALLGPASIVLPS